VGKKYSKFDRTDIIKMNNRLETMIKMNDELEAMIHKMNVDNYMKFDQLITKNIELERQLSENNQLTSDFNLRFNQLSSRITTNSNRHSNIVLNNQGVKHLFMIKLTTPSVFEDKIYTHIFLKQGLSPRFSGDILLDLECLVSPRSVFQKIKKGYGEKKFYQELFTPSEINDDDLIKKITSFI
jgi:hypothetical protein